MSNPNESTLNIPQFSFGTYAFLKADYLYFSRAVLTFGRETLIAPNEAKRITQRDDSQTTVLISV